jgi:hypothetical protein
MILGAAQQFESCKANFYSVLLETPAAIPARHASCSRSMRVQVRITVIEDSPGSLVRVDGWLAGDGVAELLRVVDSSPAPASLLLRDLRGADATGIAALRALEDRGLALRDPSPYIRLMLAEAGSHEAPGSPRRRDSETPVKRRGIA